MRTRIRCPSCGKRHSVASDRLTRVPCVRCGQPLSVPQQSPASASGASQPPPLPPRPKTTTSSSPSERPKQAAGYERNPAAWLVAGLSAVIALLLLVIVALSAFRGSMPESPRKKTTVADANPAPPSWREETSLGSSQTTGPASGPDVYAKTAEAVLIVISVRSRFGTSEAVSQGSGFVIAPGNVIVTNAHVLEGATGAEIQTFDGQRGTIDRPLVVDKERDIAILPLPTTLPPMPHLNIRSSPLRVGEPVYAIGAPRGLAYTFTSGVVSQIRREVPGYGTLIQTDTSISPGSSGGPLVDGTGSVVGVTTLASRSSLDANNLNFAVAAGEILLVKAKAE